MQLVTDGPVLHFRDGDRTIATWHGDDPFKPYLDPLRTPAGLSVSLALPHDHKHHKGLMYALRSADLNFWEERVTDDREQVGHQHHEGYRNLLEDGETIGFTQDLLWADEHRQHALFREERTVRCYRSSEAAYTWTWKTRLEALRDATLRQSQWSAALDDGRTINYHGLGLRLPRPWGCTGNLAVLLDGQPVANPRQPLTPAMGASSRTVTYEGAYDGQWPFPRASVTMTQRHEPRDTLFLLTQPFAFMALGPTNHAPRDIQVGDLISGDYEVVVADLPAHPSA